MGRGTVTDRCSALSRSIVACVALEDVMFKFKNFSSFVFHAQAVSGLGRGMCMIAVFALTLCRAAAVASLLAPWLRRRVDQEAACAALAAAELASSAFLMEFSDPELGAKSAFFCATLFLLLLLSRDGKARARCVGVPVLDRLLAVEYWLRTFCTKLRAAVWLLPFAGLLALKCALFHRYWTYRGAHFEIQRARCVCNLAVCALLVGFSAEDRNTQRFDALLGSWESAVREAWARARRRFFRRVDSKSKRY
tara:strand:+ start:738 stop:1490 length:753 start_codon:yes stop_codon:yes gene_type:complete